MKVEDLLTCSRQVWFVTNIDDAPYLLSGSCFLCRLGEDVYAVTAKHVISRENRDAAFILRHSRAVSGRLESRFPESGEWASLPASFRRIDSLLGDQCRSRIRWTCVNG
jgi:hypothetical protein